MANSIRRALAPDHEVVTETTAQAALERLTSGEQFDLVLCDIMMPDRSGIDLYADLAAKSPVWTKRLLFLTGGAFTPKAKAFFDATHVPFLEKPFDGDELRSLVTVALARLSEADAAQAVLTSDEIGSPAARRAVG